MMSVQPRVIDPAVMRARLGVDSSSPSGLRWLQAGSRGIKPGDAAGCMRPDGYWCVGVGGLKFLAHRLVFALATGEDPGEAQIDHINGLRSDNRLENLRLATPSQNACNSWARGPGRYSDMRGVTRRTDGGRKVWRTQITAHGRNIFIGHYATEAEAAAAYDGAARILHGDFACLNSDGAA